MVNMNPITKNQPYKYSWLDKAPIVPSNMALILYPHDSREHCNVYLQEDTVFPEAIKKWHLDRIAYITLQPFEFQHRFRFSLSDGINQWVEITYKFIVSVKPNKDAVKIILKNNVTDISEPILECFENFILDKSFSSLELSLLEAFALNKIRDMLSRISYLKIQVSQEEALVDDISKKLIEYDKIDKLRKAEVIALQKRLTREKEEAEARRKEAEIAREKAETEKELAEIRRKAELEELQHNIDKKTKEVAAQKTYELQQAENVAAIARVQLENIEEFGLENLAAIDSTYQGYINIQQTKKDLERENKLKDLELAKQKILLIKEMVEAGALDDMIAGQMTQQLLLGGGSFAESQISMSSSSATIEDRNVINISEDGKVDV